MLLSEQETFKCDVLSKTSESPETMDIPTEPNFNVKKTQFVSSNDFNEVGVSELLITATPDAKLTISSFSFPMLYSCEIDGLQVTTPNNCHFVRLITKRRFFHKCTATHVTSATLGEFGGIELRKCGRVCGSRPLADNVQIEHDILQQHIHLRRSRVHPRDPLCGVCVDSWERWGMDTSSLIGIFPKWSMLMNNTNVAFAVPESTLVLDNLNSSSLEDIFTTAEHNPASMTTADIGSSSSNATLSDQTVIVLIQGGDLWADWQMADSFQSDQRRKGCRLAQFHGLFLLSDRLRHLKLNIILHHQRAARRSTSECWRCCCSDPTRPVPLSTMTDANCVNYCIIIFGRDAQE
ncbi:hypothetical protein BLNAU_21910 [Blattamonas nauphoetae]|uniref:Uncharacterized protein n=1 Tax=Blattamonas nauphoetae TaxID=2049346 RepID=A0ABQ9WWX7_9EUKA|nr:hypothetical protein BLNAU_21910 [Blattamonas nauphoetae]